jgi:hypothetical protein
MKILNGTQIQDGSQNVFIGKTSVFSFFLISPRLFEFG